MKLRPLCAIPLALAALLLTPGCKTFETDAMEPPRYTIIHPDGTEVSREALFDDAAQADVVLVGETHDNPAAHHLEYLLFKGLLERRSEEGAPPRIALSLEILARDLQPVTDEYLSGLISESHFMAASRPWANYGRSYRQTLNLAKERGAPVIAANAPRRYVNLVSRKGKEALEQLTPDAKNWIAPLPYQGASPTYRSKLTAIEAHFADEKTTTHSPHKSATGKQIPARINPDAQALWDATMAWSIAEARKESPENLVMHISGIFHCEGGLGIPEHLALYDPLATVLIITIKPLHREAPLPSFRSVAPLREYLIFTE